MAVYYTNHQNYLYIPPKEIRRLREITRERRTFVKQTTQIKNRMHAILLKRGIKIPSSTLCKSTLLWLREKLSDEKIILHYPDLLEYHKQKLSEIDNTISDTAYANNNAKLLMTIPGIGTTRSLDIVAEIGEINRFPTAQRLCSYAGLVPSIHQSGNTLRIGRLVKQSSKVLKHTLIETCWTMVCMKETNSLKEFYKKQSVQQLEN